MDDDDDEGLWVPLVRPRVDEYDDEDEPLWEEPRAQGSSEEWLAGASVLMP
jgi:hypothetical protein